MNETHIFSATANANRSGHCLRVALGFPSTYAVGMSSLGFQWIYLMLNKAEGVRCDRFFLPEVHERAEAYAAHRGPVRTLETNEPISNYHVVAFSVSYETDYVHVVSMLRWSGLKRTSARDAKDPLVMAGGLAVSANPEPIADYLDLVAVGEGEGPLSRLIKVCRELEGTPWEVRKPAIIEALRGKAGIYIPSDYEHELDDEGMMRGIRVKNGAPEFVDGAWLERVEEPARSAIVTSGSAFPDMYMVEMSRGCPYTCRFCLAGNVGRKYREVPKDEAIAAVRSGLEFTKNVGLVGAAFSASKSIESVCRFVSESKGRISFSSVRITPQFAGMLDRMGESLDARTITLAPETASDRLRKVIDKDAVDTWPEGSGAKVNLKNLKLYYLLGIPGETEEEAAAIPGHADGIRSRLAPGARVTISVNALAPKSHTPMQWCAMATESEWKKKSRRMAEAARTIRSMTCNVKSFREAEFQAALARGDRRMCGALEDMSERGAAVSEFPKAMKRAGLKMDFYARRERGEKEIFPWDTLRHGCEKTKLRSEYERLREAAGA